MSTRGHIAIKENRKYKYIYNHHDSYIDEWWPKELIPFGYDGGGNSFCFHKTSGKIYYVYEDTYDDDGNVPIECLASDFLSFINNMVAEE